MRKIQFKNNATSKLSAGISAGDTSLSLTPGDGSKFPSLSAGQFFTATLVKSDGTQEIIKVTARSTDTLSGITRAFEAVAGVQTAYAFSAGDRVELRLTAESFGTELDRIENSSPTAAQSKSANYTVVEADNNDLFRVSTSGGAVTITLPQISTLTDEFQVLVGKVTGDTNNVVISRSGSDTINGASTYNLTAQYQSAWLIADRTNSVWTAINSGNSGSNVVVDVFSGNGTQTAFTLSGDPGSKNNTIADVGGVAQLKSAYSLSGTTLTFTSAPPSGTNNIEIWWTQPNPIGTPSDGTVTAAKMTDAAVPDKIHAATSKATPVDADEIGIVDSAASNGLKKLTWANLKATLKTYFDTIYTLANLLPSQTGNGGKLLKTDGSSASWGGSPNSGTAVNTTSGTAIDFTSIPSWVKRITVMLNEISTNGTSNIQAQIGTSSGVENASYVGTCSNSSGTSTAMASGFMMLNNVASASTYTGVLVITKVDGNTWAVSGVANLAGTRTYTSAGVKTLGGTLDRVRVTTVNGTDTFDAGLINIIYE